MPRHRVSSSPREETTNPQGVAMADSKYFRRGKRVAITALCREVLSLKSDYSVWLLEHRFLASMAPNFR